MDDTPQNPIQVGNRKIGKDQPLFTIAEIGINHDGKLVQAKKLVEAAAAAECDSAKFQLFTAKNMYVHKAAAGTYVLMGKKIPIYELVASVEMPPEWLPELQDHCRSHDILFFSSIFDFNSLRIADKTGMGFFKFASYDCTNLPLLAEAAKTRKPLIVSTGGASFREAAEAAETMRGVPFALMHCVIQYPARFPYANLAVIPAMKQALGCPVGFSDNGFQHDNGKIDDGRMPDAAAAAGADLFEIHITLDRKLPGPDHGFATEPGELKKMVKSMQAIRQDYLAGKAPPVPAELWGSPLRKLYGKEQYVRDFCYRQIFAIRDIPKGEKFTSDNVALLRPGESKECGIEPKFYPLVLKARATRAVKQWEAIQWTHLLS